MTEAVGTPCHDYDRCWHPLEVPDGSPFVSPEAAVVWVLLLLFTVVVLLHAVLRR